MTELQGEPSLQPGNPAPPIARKAIHVKSAEAAETAASTKYISTHFAVVMLVSRKFIDVPAFRGCSNTTTAQRHSHRYYLAQPHSCPARSESFNSPVNEPIVLHTTRCLALGRSIQPPAGFFDHTSFPFIYPFVFIPLAPFPRISVSFSIALILPLARRRKYLTMISCSAARLPVSVTTRLSASLHASTAPVY